MESIKNEDLTNVIAAVGDLMKMRLKPKTALKVRDLHRAVKTRFEDVEEERKKLIEDYAEKDEQGNNVPGERIDGQETVKIREEGKKDFQDSIKALYEVEFDPKVTFTLADFEGLDIEPLIFIRLGNLVNE